MKHNKIKLVRHYDGSISVISNEDIYHFDKHYTPLKGKTITDPMKRINYKKDKLKYIYF